MSALPRNLKGFFDWIPKAAVKIGVLDKAIFKEQIRARQIFQLSLFSNRSYWGSQARCKS